eukprot:CAMPEP_0185692384 /NCGR_PEP_ID=MMETSP1164-20130828/2489_1 /TAXON_ID=1104430 /ORGANISM="Chrysoreinhardia sp, Strain CCMP2950" /LENGTH=52 /DNA_ID=CAMNT_0028359111 /DNA_START=3223 /DNA_END=3381 /DNA_ORIENTATION=-
MVQVFRRGLAQHRAWPVRDPDDDLWLLTQPTPFGANYLCEWKRQDEGRRLSS